MSIKELEKMYMPHEYAVRAEPAWRWNRIVELAGKDAPRFLTSDDDLIRRGVYFLKDFNAAIDNDAQRSVFERHELTYLAHAIFRTNRTMVSVIESMIMSDVPVSAIAKSISQRDSVIERYEKLFFDVREQCKNPTYVTTCLMPEAVTSPGAGDFDTKLKLLSRFRGPKIIKSMVSKFAMDDESAEQLRDSIKVELLKGSMDVLPNVKPNGHNFMEYLQASEVVEIENKEDTAGGSTAIAVQLLQQLQFLPPQTPTESAAVKEISLSDIRNKQLEAK